MTNSKPKQSEAAQSAPKIRNAGSADLPVVDLVVVIDTSASMQDEAADLSRAVDAAIEAARSSCPSDLRVTYLGIEGTFKATRFDKTVRNYLTKEAGADPSALKGRLRGTVAAGGAQEDGARAIEDVTERFDWRPGAARAILYLGDEAFEGGGVVRQDDIAAADRAIATAQQGGVRVHTYVGSISQKLSDREALASEYARMAKSTGGQSYSYKDSLSNKDSLNGFETILRTVICGSRSAPDSSGEPCGCLGSKRPKVKEPATTSKPALKSTRNSDPKTRPVDEIYAIVYGDARFTNRQGDNGDVYAHRRDGACLRKVLESADGSGWSNATDSKGVHYIGWNGNQIYSRAETDAKITYHRPLSGGDPKDAFAFRQDDTGYFFSARERGKVYWFTDPTRYKTLQVHNSPANKEQVFTSRHEPIDLAFDGDDRAYLLDAAGHVWIVTDTRAAQWQAQYLTQFGRPVGKLPASYFGIAFDAQGVVYLCGGVDDGSNDYRFIATSSFDKPDQVHIIYQGEPGSGSYGNLSSRAYPKVWVPLE
jgi:hypothetical protein